MRWSLTLFVVWSAVKLQWLLVSRQIECDCWAAQETFCWLEFRGIRIRVWTNKQRILERVRRLRLECCRLRLVSRFCYLQWIAHINGYWCEGWVISATPSFSIVNENDCDLSDGSPGWRTEAPSLQSHARCSSLALTIMFQLRQNEYLCRECMMVGFIIWCCMYCGSTNVYFVTMLNIHAYQTVTYKL